MEWNLDPILFDFGFLKIHYYGVIFALGIYIGYLLWTRQMVRQGCPQKQAEDFVIWGVAAVVIGARLGHCFFYEFGYYSRHPIEILFFWKGGLASHGATIALLLVLYLYHRFTWVPLLDLELKYKQDLLKACEKDPSAKTKELPESIHRELNKKGVGLPQGTLVMSEKDHWTIQGGAETYRLEKEGKEEKKKCLSLKKRMPLLVIFDCFSFAAGVGATAVRIGNFFNSEIVGRVSGVPWAMKFPRYEHFLSETTGRYLEPQPRHPSQLYEVALGLFVLAILFAADRHFGKDRPKGLLGSLFLIFYFTGRFIVEYFKEYQTLPPSFPFTMGQILSIPFALTGYLMLGWVLKGHFRLKKSASLQEKP